MSLLIIKTVLHYSLHLLFPIAFAKFFYGKKWVQASSLLLLSMLVDIDHLWATPIFDPNRCSIGFHTFHTYWAIGLYFFGSIFLRGNLRILAFGLLFHMATDFQDYYFWPH